MPPVRGACRVAAGADHSLVVTEREELLVWGSNSHGQIGNNSLDNVLRPITVIPRNMKAVAAGRFFSLALTLDGELMVWGFNEDGILGIGSAIEKQQTPVKLDTGGLKIKHMAGGWKHILAVTEEGLLLAWGNNDYGQLGDGSTHKRRRPAQTLLPGGIRCKAVAAGWYHSLVLTEEGAVFGAGMGFAGRGGDQEHGRQMGRGAGFVQVIRAGIDQISAGGSRSLALTKTGTVLAWGGNDHGEVGNGSFQFQPSPVAVLRDQAVIAAGTHHSVAANEDYEVYVWGYGVLPANGEAFDCPARISVNEPNPMNCQDGAYFIAAGEAHTVVVGPDGEVVAFGRNLNGQVGIGSTKDVAIPLEILPGGTVEIISSAERLAALMKGPSEDYSSGGAIVRSDKYVKRDAAPLVFGPSVQTYKGHRGIGGGVPDLLRKSSGVSLSKDLVVHVSKPAGAILTQVGRSMRTAGRLAITG
eukprot:TRINITY_DN8941_c0_g7_i1.p1 TRINITY_DN8941_c0_g7~~TRINITY_DN8941_c0_g7_i1.p1  ORF type:complete len:478 (+),score=63.12 TRINITY_DN8941_c0_g7_i1:25-1434(+)